jgi:hypothetical protein
VQDSSCFLGIDDKSMKNQKSLRRSFSKLRKERIAQMGPEPGKFHNQIISPEITLKLVR